MSCHLVPSESCLKLIAINNLQPYSFNLGQPDFHRHHFISLYDILDKTAVLESDPRQQLPLRGSTDIYKLILYSLVFYVIS